MKFKVLIMLFILLPPLFISACGLNVSFPVSGVVLDKQTGKPIENAVVIARWVGDSFGFVHSPTVCFHIATALTDKNGRYRIPSQIEKVLGMMYMNMQVGLTAYKAGYRDHLYREKKKYETASRALKKIFIKKDNDKTEARIHYLSKVISGSICGDKKSQRKNISLYKLIFKEAKKITQAADNENYLLTIQRQIASIWSDTDINLPLEKYDDIFHRELLGEFQ